jgi:hypothetical protein
MSKVIKSYKLFSDIKESLAVYWNIKIIHIKIGNDLWVTMNSLRIVPNFGH